MRFIQLGIFLFILGFAPHAYANPEFGVQKQAVINGHAASDSVYSAVVSLAIESGDMLYSYCSGVLIRKNIVLTAAHCLENEDGFDFEHFYHAGKIRVALGQHVVSKLDTSSYGIDHFIAHPDFYRNHHDLALVFLDNDVPTTKAEPVDVYSDNSRLRAFATNHQAVEFVGFGMDEQDNSGNRLRVDSAVNAYCPNAVNDCSFTVLSKEKVAIPPGSLLHEIQSGGPCRGDSGGPVILENNTGLHVLGIVSYGDADCKAYSVSTSVADHIDWIERGMNEAEPSEGCSASPLRQNSDLDALILLLLLSGVAFLRKKSQLSVANNSQ
ncbi:MAG: trypsin-like serine protease [Proteobacteria bacterium]|nr:trypsin-like serine protease [Pseudomonadota bacterium]